MSSIKQTNALFKKALANDGKIDAKEAKHIAGVLKKHGVSGAENKAAGAQVRAHKDAFKSGARKALSPLLTHHKAPPSFPGAKATPAQLQKWEAEMHKFLDGNKAPIRERATKNRSAFDAGRGSAAQAATSGNVVIKSSGGTIEDKAAKALGDLKEPPFPGKDATEAELAQFQKDLGKYNRAYEMFSKIMANSHEMKKALIGNLPR